MARRSDPNEMTVFVEVDRNLPEPLAKLSIGRLGRFIHGEDIPPAALAARKSWWRIRRLPGRRYEFIEMVDQPSHPTPRLRTEPRVPPPTFGRAKVEWAGVSFVAVSLHDGGLFRGWPGLFGLVHRAPSGVSALLFVEAVEDLANAAGPGHALWSAAVGAGANELHVALIEGQRVDRLGLAARIVRHLKPALNDVTVAARAGTDGEQREAAVPRKRVRGQ